MNNSSYTYPLFSRHDFSAFWAFPGVCSHEPDFKYRW